jgi:hypothetical protein
MVVAGVTPSLIVTGPPGFGKSHSILECIENSDLTKDDYIINKGYSTPRGLYNCLYDNFDKLIIFDDCDSVLEDKVALNILKSALDSYDERIITWMSKINKGDKYPPQFEFKGRIIFISNKSKSDIDEAILSRSLTVDLSMTFDEKIMRMTSILPNILPDYDIDIKKDALKFLKTLDDDTNINLRTLIMVIKMRSTFTDDWESMAKYMITG